jgi:hypothetical protein
MSHSVPSFGLSSDHSILSGRHLDGNWSIHSLLNSLLMRMAGFTAMTVSTDPVAATYLKQENLSVSASSRSGPP